MCLQFSGERNVHSSGGHYVDGGRLCESYVGVVGIGTWVVQ